MACLPKAVPSEIDKKIAAHILEEIEDGACIQLGIGGAFGLTGDSENAIVRLVAGYEFE